MRSGPGKPKATGGRARTPGAVAEDGARGDAPALLGATPADQPTRGPGSQLVHELGGTLAAIALHLRMASEQALPSPMAQHIDAAATALQSTRSQLTRLAELLLYLERSQRPAKLQRTP